MKKKYMIGIAGMLLFCAGQAMGQINVGTGGTGIQASEEGQADIKTDDSGTANKRGRRSASIAARRGNPGNASANLPAPANNLSGNGRTMSYACKPGDEVLLTGNDNIVAIHGECLAVRTYGNNNQVKIDAVDEILVNGTGNLVNYDRLYQARRLKSSVAGPNNQVSSGHD